MKFAIVGSLFLAGVVVLLVVSLPQGSVNVYSVREILAAAPVKPGATPEMCRVDTGKVVSIENWSAPLEFTIQDGDDATATLRVRSERNPPDNLKVGGGVGVRGIYNRDSGVFKAVEVTTKCPSRYEGDDGKAAGGTYSNENRIAPMRTPEAP